MRFFGKSHVKNKKEIRFAVWCSKDAVRKIQDRVKRSNKPVKLVYRWEDDRDKDLPPSRIPSINTTELADYYRRGLIDGVLLSGEFAHFTIGNRISERYDLLKKNGINNVYGIPATLVWTPIDQLSDADINNIMTPIEGWTEPEDIKLLIHEGCNLKCSGCSHFASINAKPHRMTYDEYCRDLRRVKEIFGYVKTIQLLGGEPLLNRDIDRMIIEARRIFPYSGLAVITNGLLLNDCSDELLDIFFRGKVVLLISVYKPTLVILDDIEKRLKKHNVYYEKFYMKDTFRIQYNLNGVSDADEVYERCYDRICHTITRGRLGGCYFATTVQFANECWNLNIPDEYTYDIYDRNIDGVELYKAMSRATPLCSYCNGTANDVPMTTWKVVEDPPNINDWFV